MTFAHDTVEALESAVFLANSELEPDTLTTLGELRSFFTGFGYTGELPSASELEPIRAIRSQLRELFLSTRDEAVPIVNRILAKQRALPQLVRHGEHDWHIHAVAPDAPLATRIAVEAAMAMIDVIRADEMSRLGHCADPDCEGLVLDLSRNRSRRFCSTTCTNRAAVAAYRARQR